MNRAPTLVRQSPQSLLASAGAGPSATSASRGSLSTTTVPAAASGANISRTDLKLTSNASGPTLYGFNGSASNDAGSCGGSEK
jgi:hypothetical protein